MKDKIKELQKIKEDLEVIILKLAGWKPGAQLWSVVGNWDCKKSICGLCCYNHYQDPVHDDCVFCGQPEERK